MGENQWTSGKMPHCQILFLGIGDHPDVLCATRLVGILGHMRLQVEHLDWWLCAGHLVKALHTWLCVAGSVLIAQL